MRANSGLSLLLLIVSGCVTINVPKVNPGSYPNFREMAVAQMELLPYGNIPKDFVRSFNICAVDVMLTHYTSAELVRLDQYARGEVRISDAELKHLEGEIEDRMGGEDGLMRDMKARCPEVLEQAAKYKQANS